jgi:hypothetical protein
MAPQVTRLQQEEFILTAIKASITALGTSLPQRHTKKIVYASSPITTGLRMYSIFHKHHVTSEIQLNSIDPLLFKRDIVQANSAAGITFAESIRRLGHPYVIAPGVFFAQGWEQKHYISLWEKVIRTYADVICFNTDWQFSTGCVQEFLIGLQSGKELRNRQAFKLIEPQEELKKIKAAVNTIEKSGYSEMALALFEHYRSIELFLTNPQNLI